MNGGQLLAHVEEPIELLDRAVLGRRHHLAERVDDIVGFEAAPVQARYVLVVAIDDVVVGARMHHRIARVGAKDAVVAAHRQTADEAGLWRWLRCHSHRTQLGELAGLRREQHHALVAARVRARHRVDNEGIEARERCLEKFFVHKSDPYFHMSRLWVRYVLPYTRRGLSKRTRLRGLPRKR